MDLIMKKERRDINFLRLFTGILIANIFVSDLGLYSGRTSPPLMVGSVALSVLSFLLLMNRKNGTEISVKRLLPLSFIGLLFAIYGLKFSVPTYVLYAFIFLFQMPLFFLSMNNGLMKKFVEIFSKWFVLFYSFYIAGSLLLSPMVEGQYTGVLTNPNQWGECVAAAVTVILYLLETTENKRFKYYLYILLGISIANVIFSKSRTTLLATIAILLIYLIFVFKSKIDAKKKLISILLVLAVAIPGTYVILAHVTPYTADFVGIEIQRNGVTGNFGDALTSSYDRYLKGINDEGSFSSGRVEIWQAYISEIGFAGHEPTDLFINDYGDNGIKTNAHNSFLQIGYYAGIPALILFAVHVAAVGIFCLKKLFRKDFFKEDFFALAALGQAVVYMMLANSFGPYTAFAVVGFWVVTVTSYMIDNQESCQVQGILPKRRYFG